MPFTLADRELERLSRYETALKTSLQRAYALLERRQSQRTSDEGDAPHSGRTKLGPREGSKG